MLMSILNLTVLLPMLVLLARAGTSRQSNPSANARSGCPGSEFSFSDLSCTDLGLGAWALRDLGLPPDRNALAVRCISISFAIAPGSVCGSVVLACWLAVYPLLVAALLAAPRLVAVPAAASSVPAFVTAPNGSSGIGACIRMLPSPPPPPKVTLP